jgi:hypothetical protein
MSSHQRSLNPSSIARILGLIAFLLVLASVAGQLASYLTKHNHIYGLVRLFNVDAEQNIPTYFSTLLLLLATVFLSVITILQRKQKAPYVSHWVILSLGFFYMAADEALSFHEMLIGPIRNLLGEGHVGIFTFSWVIPGMMVVFVLGLFYLKFWLHLPLKTRLIFLMAAVIYIGGAIGCELIGGRYAELYGQKNLTYSLMTTAEEGLEMAGVIVFVWGLLLYIADHYKEVRFRFDGIGRKITIDFP